MKALPLHSRKTGRCASVGNFLFSAKLKILSQLEFSETYGASRAIIDVQPLTPSEAYGASVGPNLAESSLVQLSSFIFQM